jgi:uncharacterized protein (TIGR02217 family)
MEAIPVFIKRHGMFYEISLPQGLAFGSRGGPAWLTSLQASPAGPERREQRWSAPRRRWDIGLVNRNRVESEALLAFFYCIAQGKAHGWRFRDFEPGEDTGRREPLGVGTGASAVYQLVKRSTSGAMTYDRVITKPIAGTLQVFANTTETAAFTVDTTTGKVTLTAEDGAVLTASYRFEVPCRFDTDDVRMSRVDIDMYSWEAVPIVELRTP